MSRSILSITACLILVCVSCGQRVVSKPEMKPEKGMLTPPKTSATDNGWYIVLSESIPADVTIASTTNAEKTMNVGMQLALKKLNLPFKEMVGWPGEISMEKEGILHPDTRKSSQSYITHVGNEEVTITLSLVSIRYVLAEVDCARENDEMVISINDSGTKRCLQLNTDLHQPGNKYSQTVTMGLQVEAKLKNGKSASQVVYMIGVVEFTPQQFKSFKYSL